MKIFELIQRPDITENTKLYGAYQQFAKLLSELTKRELPDEIVISINRDIEEINSMPNSAKELRKLIKKKQTAILPTLEKELKLVVKNHYRNLWLSLGMATFGLPIGVVFGTIQENMGLLGVGLPIGMVIGMVLGARMDKKVEEEDRQLDLEIEY